MTKVGIGLPGISVIDTRSAAKAARDYDFDSFSVYGDLGDLPPYAVLHASADLLRDSNIKHIGPMGVPAGMLHPDVVAVHAAALEEQLPDQTFIGLVRGAFLEQINAKPARLELMASAVEHIKSVLADREIDPPIYIGGFGPKILALAGELGIKGVKLGGTANPALADKARQAIDNPDVEIILGAVSVIDHQRKPARELARREVAKYLNVVGAYDPTLDADEIESLEKFKTVFAAGDPDAHKKISDSLLDKFAIAGTPSDAHTMLDRMDGMVDRFEFGTPHGRGNRSRAIKSIGEEIVNTRRSQ